MKRLIFLLAIIILIVSMNIQSEEVCIGENCFEIEVVSNDPERSKGLMFREKLEGGMLFVYEDEGVRNFWMKNTLIPLDMIWINKNKEIIYIEENVQPCENINCESYGINENSMYVLEINGGESSKRNIKVGDKVIF
ncbi:MAG: hypothetical protein CMH64_02575 [Nanoarchaeota archaeon]|nr:hypothetical protein [Nanoarchaeota archaeon]|tara:strand:+ start:279 stop:689 length:411 start_codon:yes stop_codon:yes gene_type:complete